MSNAKRYKAGGNTYFDTIKIDDSSKIVSPDNKEVNFVLGTKGEIATDVVKTYGKAQAHLQSGINMRKVMDVAWDNAILVEGSEEPYTRTNFVDFNGILHESWSETVGQYYYAEDIIENNSVTGKIIVLFTKYYNSTDTDTGKEFEYAPEQWRKYCNYPIIYIYKVNTDNVYKFIVNRYITNNSDWEDYWEWKKVEAIDSNGDAVTNYLYAINSKPLEFTTDNSGALSTSRLALNTPFTSLDDFQAAATTGSGGGLADFGTWMNGNGAGNFAEGDSIPTTILDEFSEVQWPIAKNTVFEQLVDFEQTEAPVYETKPAYTSIIVKDSDTLVDPDGNPVIGYSDLDAEYGYTIQHYDTKANFPTTTTSEDADKIFIDDTNKFAYQSPINGISGDAGTGDDSDSSSSSSNAYIDNSTYTIKTELTSDDISNLVTALGGVQTTKKFVSADDTDWTFKYNTVYGTVWVLNANATEPWDSSLSGNLIYYVWATDTKKLYYYSTSDSSEATTLSVLSTLPNNVANATDLISAGFTQLSAGDTNLLTLDSLDDLVSGSTEDILEASEAVVNYLFDKNEDYDWLATDESKWALNLTNTVEEIQGIGISSTATGSASLTINGTEYMFIYGYLDEFVSFYHIDISTASSAGACECTYFRWCADTETWYLYSSTDSVDVQTVVATIETGKAYTEAELLAVGFKKVTEATTLVAKASDITLGTYGDLILPVIFHHPKWSGYVLNNANHDDLVNFNDDAYYGGGTEISNSLSDDYIIKCMWASGCIEYVIYSSALINSGLTADTYNIYYLYTDNYGTTEYYVFSSTDKSEAISCLDRINVAKPSKSAITGLVPVTDATRLKLQADDFADNDLAQRAKTYLFTYYASTTADSLDGDNNSTGYIQIDYPDDETASFIADMSSYLNGSLAGDATDFTRFDTQTIHGSLLVRDEVATPKLVIPGKDAIVDQNGDNIAFASDVSFTQTQTDGIELGTFSVNGEDTTIYAPDASLSSSTPTTLSNTIDVKTITVGSTSATISVPKTTYTQTVTSGTKLGTINFNGTSTTVYAPTVPEYTTETWSFTLEDGTVIEKTVLVAAD